MTEVFHLVALRFISLCSAKGKIRKDQIDKSFVSQRFVKTWRQWTRLYSSNTHKQFNTMSSENTLEAQWVGLHDLTAKDAGSIPGWGNSCKSLSMAKKKKCPPTLMKHPLLLLCILLPSLQTPAFQRHQLWFRYWYPKTHPYALIRRGSFHLNLIFLSISPVSKDKRVKWRYS